MLWLLIFGITGFFISVTNANGPSENLCAAIDQGVN